MRGSFRCARLWTLMLGVCMCIALSGCDAVERLGEVLYPTEAPPVATVQPLSSPSATPVMASPTAQAQQPTIAPSLAATSVAPTTALPTPTQAPRPQPTDTPPPVTATPAVADGQSLVFVRGDSIYRGDQLGAGPIEVSSIAQLESRSFSRGRLAMAQGRYIYIIDLNRSSLYGIQVGIEGRVEYAEVRWGTTGAALLHTALVADPKAEKTGRNVEIRALNPEDGAQLGLVRLSDLSGASILRYDDQAMQVMLIQGNADQAFSVVETYDLKSGKLAATWPTKGEADAVVSPEGRYLLAQQFTAKGGQLALYDLQTRQPQPRVWPHPDNSHSVAHIWSSDGRYVAYLLREGRTYADESVKALGVWVLDVATMKAKKVLDEAFASSTMISWMPDGAYLVGYHRGQAQDVYFYAVRADGSDRRVLPLGPDAEILGWMSPTKAPVPKVVIDPWRARFMAAIDDPLATAEMAAQFVLAQGKADEKAVAKQLREHLEQVGWKIEPSDVSLKRLADGLAVARLPPVGIYIFDGERVQPVASGHVIVDARLAKGEELGLIYGIKSGKAVQPDYMLLRRQAEGEWKVLWTPQGRRDWIATDGEVRFVGTGLQGLEVKGTSFGLDSGEGQIFSECQECPHRQLSATWVRQGDAYVRQTKLPMNASLPDVLWEMTERKPYSVLYECLRRLRAGLPAQDLADEQALSQISALGLLDKGVRLIAESETADKVHFSDAVRQARFVATIRGGRVRQVEKLTK